MGCDADPFASKFFTSLLTNTQVDEIIEYLSESWDQRCLNYVSLHNELQLECNVETLDKRLKQRGYF